MGNGVTVYGNGWESGWIQGGNGWLGE